MIQAEVRRFCFLNGHRAYSSIRQGPEPRAGLNKLLQTPMAGGVVVPLGETRHMASTTQQYSMGGTAPLLAHLSPLRGVRTQWAAAWDAPDSFLSHGITSNVI